jgi:hypothetical protein
LLPLRFVTKLFVVVCGTAVASSQNCFASSRHRAAAFRFASISAAIFVKFFSKCALFAHLSNLRSEFGWQDSAQRFEDKLRGIDEYLKYRNISLAMRRRVHAYYGNCWRTSGAIYEEDSILNDLPPNLRSIVVQQISVEAISRIPMLKGLQDVCAAEVYVNMYPHYFEEGLIYAGKEPGDEMYFLTAGTVVLHAIDLHGAENDRVEDAKLQPKSCRQVQVVPPVHLLTSENPRLP